MRARRFVARPIHYGLLAATGCMLLGGGLYLYQIRASTPENSPPVASDKETFDRVTERFDPVTGLDRSFSGFRRSDGPRYIQIQTRTHLIVLLSIGLASLAGFVLSGRYAGETGPYGVAVRCTCIGAALVGAALLWRYSGVTLAVVAVNCAVVAVLCAAQRWSMRPWLNYTAAACCLTAVAAWMAPGLAATFDYSADQWWRIESAEKHWALTISYGDRLAQGLRLYDDVFPSYSGVIAILKALYVRCFGVTSLRTDIVFVQATQLLYLGLGAWCYYLYSGRRWLCALSSIIYAGAASSFATWYFMYAPNHTAWRTIFFPVALLGVYLSRRRRPAVNDMVLGAISALSVLHNFETGVAIAFALATCTVYRCMRDFSYHTFKFTALAVAYWGSGMAIGLLVHGLTCLAVLGAWPNYPALYRNIAVVMHVVAAGHGGVKASKLDLLALVMFGHAACVFVTAFTARVHLRMPSIRDEMRLAAAATILVWFRYYANRPEPPYLCSFYLLYGVLLIDLVDAVAAVRRRIWETPEASFAAAMVIVMVILPRLKTELEGRTAEYRDGIRRLANAAQPANSLKASGVWLPDNAISAAIQTKAAFIRHRAEKGEVIYLTENCYLIPKLSGVWPALPVAEPFWESPDKVRYERLVRSIVDSQHDEIFFDAPSTVASNESPSTGWNSADFYAGLRQRLANEFTQAETRDGWERWTRKERMASRAATGNVSGKK